jgi:uncharacterized membrane protein YuzA (DUF378 family)
MGSACPPNRLTYVLVGLTAVIFILTAVMVYVELTR